MSIDVFLLKIGNLLSQEIPTRHGHVSVLGIMIVSCAGFLIAWSAREALVRKRRMHASAQKELSLSGPLHAAAFIQSAEGIAKEVSGEITHLPSGLYRLSIIDSSLPPGSIYQGNFADLGSLEHYLKESSPLRLGDFKQGN